MPFQTALIIAAFVIFAAVVIVLAVAGTRAAAARLEKMKRDAAMRGWTFEKRRERGYRVHRWSGVTDGVAWQADSLRQLSGGNNRHRRREIARWHGAWAPGLNAPIVLMGVPKGKEAPSFSVAQGDGLFARMAQKAAGFAFDKALDAYFGPEIGAEVDAGALRKVEGRNIPGFIVMAGDVTEADRVLAQGLERALGEAVTDSHSVLSDGDRPYVMLRAKGVSLARMAEFRDVEEMERFIRGGIALTRAFKFGRPA